MVGEPDLPADVPLDLTGETPLLAESGAAEGAPGARAARAGSGVSEGRGATVGEGGGEKESDRSRPVTLGAQSWSCPWPAEADAEGIDEQTVVLRVIVAADGTVESADILAEPGHGFGKAALACAWKTRFSPARDRAGAPVRAVSPPIRVRFTR